MSFALKRVLRARLALLVVASMLMSVIPSTMVEAAEPATNAAQERDLAILYSESYYKTNNPDVYAAFGDNSFLLRQHWENYGINEGRQYLTPILDVRAYRAGNADLEKAFGNNWDKYLWHFLNYGAQEIADGLRAPKGLIFDAVKYLNAHPDVRRVVGNDLLAAMQHYISSGMPVGDWVSVKYTAGPAAVSQTSSSSNVSTSSNSGNSDSSNNGGSSGGNSNPGNNGGGSGKPNPTPDEPGTSPPVIDPEQPDEPDEPVQPTHSKDSSHVKEDFGEDGKCTQGCGLTLVEFQQACKMDHSAIEIGHYCLVCGAEGTYDPSEEHTKDSLHTKNSFGEDGLCLRGCGLTLAEFQQDCTENHELHVGQVCPNCNYQGTMLYDKDECPKKDSHEYGKECDSCNYAGECLEDHGQIYTTKLCPVCGEHGTKVCEVDHSEIFVGTFCEECGIEGTKEKPEVCENEANHGVLHKGQNCQSCGYAGEADHTWDKATGECTGCDEKCPNIDNHVDILRGETCEICGYEGMKEPTLVHPDGYTHSLADFVGGKCGICGMTVDDFQRDCTSDEHETLKATGGTCSVCGKQIEKVEKPFECPNKNDHAKLHKDVPCGTEGCDYVGEADHDFVSGECECGAKDPDYKAPCTDVDHAVDKLACGEKCPNCDYVAPAHVYEDGVCTRCNNACPNGHTGVACGEQCGTCMWIAPGHSYAGSEKAGHCTRCGQECAHAFSNGTCAHCGMSDPDYCGNRFHDYCSSEGVCPDCGKATKPDHVFVEGNATCNDCDAPNPNCTKPVEHEHNWSGGTCSGAGECPGCPNAGGHGDIPTTSTCDTCGAAGTKPVYAHTENDGHEHNYVDNYCTECGCAKVGFGSGEEELDDAGGEPGKSDGTGSSAAGGNSGDEDGEPAKQDGGLPDGLPVDTVIVTEYKDNTEPDPEDDDEDDTEGGDKPADEEGNSEQSSEQPSEQST